MFWQRRSKITREDYDADVKNAYKVAYRLGFLMGQVEKSNRKLAGEPVPMAVRQFEEILQDKDFIQGEQ